MQIKFKLNDREVAGKNLESAIEEVAFAKTKEQLTAKVAGLRCPEHNQAPQLVFEGDSLKTLKLRVKACCETLRGYAMSALNAK